MVIILAGLIAQSVGCASAGAQTAEGQSVTVQRGDLRVDITAAGNLALARTEDLAFDIPSTFSKTSPITVKEVLVEAGDSVQEGQELVKLDTLEWDKQLKTLEKELVTAQRDLATAQHKVMEKEFAVSQAQLGLQSAEDNLDQIDAVKEIQDEIDDAEAILKAAKMAISGELAGSNITYWLQQITYWTARRAEAKSDLQELLRDSIVKVSSGSTAEVSRDVALQVAEGALNVQQKQMDFEDAQIAVDNAKLDEEDAKQDVTDAQSNLDEAKSLSPIIKAPFTGFITEVNVEGGDEILNGTLAMQLADPNKFEAEIMVSEMDISQVKLGGDARVEVDALSGLTLPAKVTQIAPTATIQSGVVNYKVKVEVASLEEMMQERQAAQQEATEKIQQGELPERLKQAVDSGRITQEQAEEMLKQGQQGQAGQQQQVATAALENFQLREGLTVTVSIIIDEKTDVLLVPNAAITTERGQSYVQVVTASGATEKRAIQTGITDYQFTEVTEGLAEGEQIIVPEGTTTTSTTQQGQQGMMFFGGPPRR